MIRLFLSLCKCFQLTKKNDDYQIYLDYKENSASGIVPCSFAQCGAKENYYSCGSYTRSFICFTLGCVERHVITVDRLECISCEHSHAILPPVIIPYSPFSFHFVVSLLYDYITHNYTTIAQLCFKYDISISSFYRIYDRFIEDRKLMLGMLEAASTQTIQLLEVLSCSAFLENVEGLLNFFYRSYHFSFLQARCTIRQISKAQLATQLSSP
jgi:hypothetical protein